MNNAYCNYIRSDRNNKTWEGVAINVKDGLRSCEDFTFSMIIMSASFFAKLENHKTSSLLCLNYQTGIIRTWKLHVKIQGRLCIILIILNSRSFSWWLNNDEAAAPGSYIVGSGNTAAVSNHAKQRLNSGDQLFLKEMIEKLTHNKIILDLSICEFAWVSQNYRNKQDFVMKT